MKEQKIINVDKPLAVLGWIAIISACVVFFVPLIYALYKLFSLNFFMGAFMACLSIGVVSSVAYLLLNDIAEEA